MSITGDLTGGLIDTGSPNYVGAAKKAEAFRRAQIEAGLAQINAIYGGGTAPFYSAVTTPYTQETFNHGNGLGNMYSVGKKGGYSPYKIPGLKTSPEQHPAGAIGGGDFGGTGLVAALGALGIIGANKTFPRQELNKKIRAGELFTRTDKTYKGFDDNFYQQRAQAYEDFAMPQLQQQYGDTFKQINYGLANRGLSRSTAAGTQYSTLNRETGRAQQQIADTGIAQSQQLKSSVEDARQRAISMLYQTADPAQASAAAINTASSFQAPSTFAPIANMFSNLANQYYMSNVLNSYKNQSGIPNSGFGNTYQSPNYGALPKY